MDLPKFARRCDAVRGAIVALILHCERERGGVLPSRKSIAVALGLGNPTFEKHLEFLKEEGMIERTGRSQYRVIDASLTQYAHLADLPKLPVAA